MLVKSINESTLDDRKVLSEVEATGQGFVTFTFNTKWLAHQSTHIGSSAIKSLRSTTPRRIVIDHGSPNMSKEFHVGHVRSIMIGDCLARVLRHQGHHVDTVSHVGDFGTPMALVVAYAMKTKNWAVSGFDGALPTPAELSELYTDAKAAQKADPSLAEDVSRVLKEIQKLDATSADAHVMSVYKTICEASRKGFEDVYKDLEVSIPEKGESFYAPFIPSTIEELRSKKLLTESEGALVCQLPAWNAPLLVEKSDKTWLYGTTDLACLKYRLGEANYDEALYVVDFTQNQHFEQVFEVGRQAGWITPKNRVEHVFFGIVQGSNGKKLSSRDGTTLKLRQLLDDAIVETRNALITARSLVRADRQDQEAEPASMEERMSEPVRYGKAEDANKGETKAEFLDDANIASVTSSQTENATSTFVNPASIALAEENAPKVAFNAIKYFELSQTRTNNYSFSFQSMLSFKGNTSFYIIYAYARIHTLYRRAAEQNVEIPKLSDDASPFLSDAEVEALTPKERDLALKLLQFPDILRAVEATLMPHTLSTHLFQTAQKFHSFYESCRVIGSTNQNFRFKLCLATERMLSQGLELLNVQTVNHV